MPFLCHKFQPEHPLKTRRFDTILEYLPKFIPMYEVFEEYITAHGDFTPEDLRLIRSKATVKRFRRKEFLLQEGEICRYKMFVTKGLLKTYVVRQDGVEHILRFAPENSWTTDHESMRTQTPSRANIEALENTEVILWNRESLDELLIAVPAFREYVVRLMENVLKATHERVLINLSYTSEEKYADFIASFPDIFSRVPLHMVASYLGVSRETLSRIRHARLRQ
jgi:CRP-like cAMP-binding protein